MKKLIYLFAILLLSSCASKDGPVKDSQRTEQVLVVAVEREGGSTYVSSGRLGTWYKINIPLVEGMIYDMTMEIPRVITDPIFIPAEVINYSPVDYMQRDLFGRYITKYSEMRTIKPSEVPGE